MKYVTASANSSTCARGNTNKTKKEQDLEGFLIPPMKNNKKKTFQEECYGVFIKMAKKSNVMAKN